MKLFVIGLNHKNILMKISVAIFLYIYIFFF